jgi:uncharacterized protein
MIVLIHSSKTMRDPPSGSKPTGTPALLDRAIELMTYLRTLSPAQLARVMTISAQLAGKTQEQFRAWSTDPRQQASAADSFLGDIYSGLQVASFTAADRTYADRHLRIISGLYGILRPYDGISPYRLEMGYRLPSPRYANLYRFWGTAIADELPASSRIVNLAANEYTKAVLPYVDPDRVVTPRFLTVDERSGEPKFVVVHAKIARGTFARWLITARVRDTKDAWRGFDDIGYRYEPDLSTPTGPCYVCTEFGGKGLSVRLND